MSNHAAVAGEASRIFSFLREEFKPRGPWLTPFNIISIPIMLTGVVILFYRFIYGLGYVTNLSQEHPWGLWLGFDVVTGVGAVTSINNTLCNNCEMDVDFGYYYNGAFSISGKTFHDNNNNGSTTTNLPAI